GSGSSSVVLNDDFGGRGLFPSSNWWNQDISNAPVDANSAAFITFIGTGRTLHPDFGPPPYGIPYVSVSGGQARMPITFVSYGSESDSGFGGVTGYPIPDDAKTQTHFIEGDQAGGGTSGDRHLIVVDRDRFVLFELFGTRWNSSAGRWEAGSGAIFDLTKNDRRPDGWTSADAAGLAILPGLARYEEVASGRDITHAFRVTVRATNGYVWPASHRAGSTSGALPLGARLRLKSSKNLSGYAPDIQRIFRAMQVYGLIVADNGSDMYITGAMDSRWNNGVLNPAFASLSASDFEVIQLGWKPPAGPPPSTLGFYTLPPCRLLDTRAASGPQGGPALPPAAPRVVVATGHCGIPADAKALSVNLTAVEAAQAGYLRLF